MIEGSFEGVEGVKIFTREWQPGGAELLEKNFHRITLPLLILHGTADKVTKPSGSKEFYERAGSSDKTLKLYEGYFHDPLADIGKQRVMGDIQAWIDARLATLLHSAGEPP